MEKGVNISIPYCSASSLVHRHEGVGVMWRVQQIIYHIPYILMIVII